MEFNDVPTISVSKCKEIRGDVHCHMSEQEITSLQQFNIILLSCVWSPIVFAGGVRKAENFKTCDYLGLDIDEGWTVQDAISWVKRLNLSAIIGASKSHQKPKKQPSGKALPARDRFRIVIPFSRTIKNVTEYKAIVTEIQKDIPADRACKGGAQFFYPCREILYTHIGEKLEIPAESEIVRSYEGLPPKDEIAAIQAGMMPVWMLTALRGQGAPVGMRNTTLFRIAATLTDAGFSKKEILAIVLNSPFKSLGSAEVVETVENGYRAAKKQ